MSRNNSPRKKSSRKSTLTTAPSYSYMNKIIEDANRSSYNPSLDVPPDFLLMNESSEDINRFSYNSSLDVPPKEIVDENYELGKLIDLEKFYKIARSIVIVNSTGSGFFLKFKLGNHLIKTLVTNYHVVGDSITKNLKDIFISNNKMPELKTIVFDENRKFYHFESPVDVTVILIEQRDKIEDELFLNLDEDCKNLDSYNEKDIYVISHPHGASLHFSPGKIIKIYADCNYTFAHSAGTEEGSSGSPVLLAPSLNVIGVHKGKSPNQPSNFATPFGYILKKLENKIKEEKGKEQEDEKSQSFMYSQDKKSLTNKYFKEFNTLPQNLKLKQIITNNNCGYGFNDCIELFTSIEDNKVYLVTVNKKNYKLEIRDLENNNNLVQELRGHEESIKAVRYFSDGKNEYLISSDSNQKVLLWKNTENQFQKMYEISSEYEGFICTGGLIIFNIFSQNFVIISNSNCSDKKDFSSTKVYSLVDGSFQKIIYNTNNNRTFYLIH